MKRVYRPIYVCVTSLQLVTKHLPRKTLPVVSLVGIVWTILSLLGNEPSIAVSHYRGRASSGTFDPRQVFLLYNRTPKTSSSVAASILRNSYVRSGLAIHSGPLNDFSALKGFNGRLEHMGIEPGVIEKI